MAEFDAIPLRIGKYSISPELYLKGYQGGRGPCTCTAVCCRHGVYADVEERNRVLAHKEVIKRHMDETQTKDDANWFDREEENDQDFPSGRCVSTQEVNEKCAFLDRFGRCSLQVAATQEGMHRWALKPLFCVLFPLEISGNVIGFDDLLDQEQQCCSIGEGFDVPVFEACRDELIHVLGEDGYEELQSFYQRQRPSHSSFVHEKAMR